MTVLGLSLWLALFPLSAQKNTYSPYSRYGYGLLHDPEMGQSVGMGGVSYGLRNTQFINPMNPASHSAIDSLTFLFDFAFSGAVSTFSENGNSETNMNYNLEHIALKFPLANGLGVSMGMYEYSKLGYSFSSTGVIPGMRGDDDVSYTRSYSATGGLNNYFLGVSACLFKRVAVGANLNYKFGTMQYVSSLTYPGKSVYTSQSTNDMLTLSQMNFDFGLQYVQPLGRRNRVVLGATYTPAKEFTSELTSTQVAKDTTVSYGSSSFGTPEKLGFGLSYTYDNRLTVGVDYERQGWAETPFYGKTDTLASTQRLAVGVEYLPARLGEYFYQVIKYRLGLHYSDSYLKFAAGNLKDVGLTLGFGMPLRGQRSALNLAFELGKTLTPDLTLIQENYCRMSLSVSFNEVWFMKRRFN